MYIEAVRTSFNAYSGANYEHKHTHMHAHTQTHTHTQCPRMCGMVCLRPCWHPSVYLLIYRKTLPVLFYLKHTWAAVTLGAVHLTLACVHTSQCFVRSPSRWISVTMGIPGSNSDYWQKTIKWLPFDLLRSLGNDLGILWWNFLRESWSYVLCPALTSLCKIAGVCQGGLTLVQR